MTSPEPLRGSAPGGRPARLLGKDEVDALALVVDQDNKGEEDEDDHDDTGEWKFEP